jgi:hypothetical protein
MPFLMVNLDDNADCQRAMRQLRRHLRHAGIGPDDGPGCGPPPGRKRGRGFAAGVLAPGRPGQEPGDGPALKQKLKRIQQRGVWRFLALIANLDETPRSLSEFDEALDLQPNKMRSTKAIFAKLENRLDVQFLVFAQDAGNDESGNPRYVMPPRVRKVILKLSNESHDEHDS